MRSVFLLMLCLSLCAGLRAQNINETFNNFNLPVLSNTLFLFLSDTASNDSGSILKDLSGNGHTLSLNGFSNEAATYPHLTGVNPQYESGVALTMPGASDSVLTLSSGAAADLNIRLGDYAITTIFKSGSLSGNRCIASKSGSSGGGWAIYNFNTALRVVFRSNSGDVNVPDFTLASGKYYYVNANFDRDGNATAKLYNLTDGTGPTTKSISISSKSGEDLNATSSFIIGRPSWSALWWYDGVIVSVRLMSRLVTDKEIVEDIYLSRGYSAKGLGIFRTDFNQGIIDEDTVYCAINSPGAAIGRIDAWGASGGETLTVFNKAGDTQSFELTTDSTRYTISSIAFAADDSIYFSAGAGDTLYIDNVYLEPAPPEISAAPVSSSIAQFNQIQGIINLENH